MYHAAEGYLAATNELLILHVDLRRRRVAEMPAEVSARLASLAAAQAGLTRPTEVGRVIGIRKR